MNDVKEYLRRYPCYQKAARFWWDFLDDIKTFRWFFLSSMPGKFGTYLRARILVKEFGSCGMSPFILENFRVDNPAKLFIGDNFRCNVNVYFSAGGTIEIGHHVAIGPGVKIWSINHRYDRLDIPIIEQGWNKKKIVIEDDVWIAANASILPGVCIGRGTVVAAGTVLGKSVPPYTIIAGNPGRIIGYRSKKHEDLHETLQKT